ncbi:MAG: beta strand repeat-containing protein, partial [Betaproteobacteria bacterium]
IGSGSGGTFSGAIETAGNLTLDFGSVGINMAAGSSLRAGQNLTLNSTGNLTLAEVMAGQTLTVQTSGSVTALSATDTAGAANLKAATVLVSGASIGSSTQSLRVDAVAAGATAGVIRLINTPSTPTAGNAYLDITTALNGTTRRNVELGSSTDNLTVGGLLKITASTANLVFKGNITAGSADIEAVQGSITMTDGKTLQSGGSIRLAGQTGVALSRVIGSNSDTAQTVEVRSDSGLITDLSADELANLQSAGRVTLAGRSIGAGGASDIDIQAGRIHSLNASTGAVFLESLSATQPVIGATSAVGAFDLKVGQGSALFDGNLTSGLINVDVAAGIAQTDGTSLSTAGTATLRSGGDIQLARLVGGNGTVTINATGDLLDASSSSVANIVMGTGALTIDARRIGSSSDAIDLDAGAVALLRATETTTSVSAINIAAIRAGETTTISRLDTEAQASWTQSTGNLSLAGSVTASQLALSVVSGNLNQTAGTLIVQSDLSLTVGGNISLTGMTSTTGNITLSAGGSILDASSNSEGAVLTTSAAGKSITLDAGTGIGLDAQAGDIDVSTDRIVSARTTTGGVFLASARAIAVGSVTAQTQASAQAATGNLTLTGTVSAGSVSLGATAGSLLMQGAAAVVGQTAVTMTSGADMDITRVLAASADAVVDLSARGLLRDASSQEPPNVNGWNIETAGSVALTATAIGESTNNFDVRGSQITRSANSAGAWLGFSAYTGSAGSTTLSADAISGAGSLNMILLSGNLLVTQSFSANTIDLRALSGSIEMSDGAVLTAVGDIILQSGRDMTLSRLVTNTGRVTLTAGGAIIDGSSSELANITGTQLSSSLEISAAKIGTDIPVVDERQSVDLGGATGGTFNLSLNVDGVIRTTSAIAVNTGSSDTVAARDARIGQALLALGFSGATYSVSNGEVTFGGSLAKRDLPTMLLDGAALTGTTSTVQILVGQEGGVPGDINLNIGRLTRVDGGAQGVYLQSERTIEVGALNISGDLGVELTSGDLTIS